MDTLRVILKSLGDSFISHQLLHQHAPEDAPLQPHAVSVDLEDAYFHVAVLPEHRKYLRFGYRGNVFEFQVLPFGLSTAPRTFTRIVKCISAFLKTQGVDMFQYLDDWLIWAITYQILIRSRELTLRWTHQLGFLINEKKSDLTPTVLPGFIGSEIDLWGQRALPSRERVKTMTEAARNLLRMTNPTARQWRSFLGHVASLIDLVPLARTQARAIQFNFADHWAQRSEPDRQVVPPDRH